MPASEPCTNCQHTDGYTERNGRWWCDYCGQAQPTDPTPSATPPQDQHGEREVLLDIIARVYTCGGGAMRLPSDETLADALLAAGFARQSSSGGGEDEAIQAAHDAIGEVGAYNSPSRESEAHDAVDRAFAALRARAEAAERDLANAVSQIDEETDIAVRMQQRAEAAEAKLAAYHDMEELFPDSMCREGHAEIRYWSENGNTCPVCAAESQRDAARRALDVIAAADLSVADDVRQQAIRMRDTAQAALAATATTTTAKGQGEEA
jgi:hypothetical protein